MEKIVPSFQELQTTQSQEAESIRHFGKTIPFCPNDEGQPKYVLGPHFAVSICTILITTALGIGLTINITSNSKGRQVQMGIGLTLALLFYIYSYIKVTISNPGLASRGQQPPEQMKTSHRYCAPCKLVRPIRTVHCYSCDICIFGYDHHCPWIGKCVGRDNMSHFKCFIFSVLLIFVTLGVSIFVAGQYEPATVPHKMI